MLKSKMFLTYDQEEMYKEINESKAHIIIL